MDNKTDKEIQAEMKKIQNELLQSFEQSMSAGCQKLIELAAEHTLSESAKKERFINAAANRLAILFGYCAFYEQPFFSNAAIRILRESETDKEMQRDLQYDANDEFERSVNEVLCACLNYYKELGNVLCGEEVMNNVD